jgi:hypothetical protein
MAFNKKSHLQTNIEAIKIAFTLDKEKRIANKFEQKSCNNTVVSAA